MRLTGRNLSRREAAARAISSRGCKSFVRSAESQEPGAAVRRLSFRATDGSRAHSSTEECEVTGGDSWRRYGIIAADESPFPERSSVGMGITAKVPTPSDG